MGEQFKAFAMKWLAYVVMCAIGGCILVVIYLWIKPQMDISVMMGARIGLLAGAVVGSMAAILKGRDEGIGGKIIASIGGAVHGAILGPIVIKFLGGSIDFLFAIFAGACLGVICGFAALFTLSELKQ